MNRRWLLGVPVLFALVACQIIAGLEEPEGITPPVVESDAGSDASKDPCTHSTPPPPPVQDSDPATKNDYWFAATNLEIPLQQNQKNTRGFDLDNGCTCSADLHDGGPSCTLKGNPKGTCDLDGGIDDAFASTFATALAASKQDVAAPVNSELADGTRTLLLYLGEYNGKANDSSVFVQFVNAGGLYDKRGCTDAEVAHTVTVNAVANDDRTPPGKDRLKPNNDGCDRWSPEVGKLNDVDRRPPLSVQGYVTNFQLVVTVGEIASSIFGGAARFRGALTVATLSQENGHFRIDGIIGARMPYEDLLKVLGSNQIGDGQKDGGYTALCEDPGLWFVATSKICGARDVLATTTDDYKGLECDAVSLNIGVSFVEARISDFEYNNKLVRKACPDFTCP